MKEELLKFNEEFVNKECYKPYMTSKYPDKKIAIVTCMDTRLVELLPAALGIKNGDVKMIKNAGGMIDNPWDSTMRSLLVGVYELGVEEIMIIGHTECGVQCMSATEMLHLMKERGITDGTIDMVGRCGIDLEKWLTGFSDTAQAVKDTVELVSRHPLLPAGIEVTGYIMDSVTGKIEAV
ncbi:MAG: carbonic anhydrase [Muribaculaceae bacterium]|nr:carbonic anhydrase [Muribaculaceae bacterium]